MLILKSKICRCLIIVCLLSISWTASASAQEEGSLIVVPPLVDYTPSTNACRFVKKDVIRAIADQRYPGKTVPYEIITINQAAVEAVALGRGLAFTTTETAPVCLPGTEPTSYRVTFENFGGEPDYGDAGCPDLCAAINQTSIRIEHDRKDVMGEPIAGYGGEYKTTRFGECDYSETFSVVDSSMCNFGIADDLFDFPVLNTRIEFRTIGTELRVWVHVNLSYFHVGDELDGHSTLMNIGSLTVPFEHEAYALDCRRRINIPLEDVFPCYNGGSAEIVLIPEWNDTPTPEWSAVGLTPPADIGSVPNPPFICQSLPDTTRRTLTILSDAQRSIANSLSSLSAQLSSMEGPTLTHQSFNAFVNELGEDALGALYGIVVEYGRSDNGPQFLAQFTHLNVANFSRAYHLASNLKTHTAGIRADAAINAVYLHSLLYQFMHLVESENRDFEMGETRREGFCAVPTPTRNEMIIEEQPFDFCPNTHHSFIGESNLVPCHKDPDGFVERIYITRCAGQVRLICENQRDCRDLSEYFEIDNRPVIPTKSCDVAARDLCSYMASMSRIHFPSGHEQRAECGKTALEQDIALMNDRRRALPPGSTYSPEGCALSYPHYPGSRADTSCARLSSVSKSKYLEKLFPYDAPESIRELKDDIRFLGLKGLGIAIGVANVWKEEQTWGEVWEQGSVIDHRDYAPGTEILSTPERDAQMDWNSILREIVLPCESQKNLLEALACMGKETQTFYEVSENRRKNYNRGEPTDCIMCRHYGSTFKAACYAFALRNNLRGVLKCEVERNPVHLWNIIQIEENGVQYRYMYDIMNDPICMDLMPANTNSFTLARRLLEPIR